MPNCIDKDIFSREFTLGLSNLCIKEEKILDDFVIVTNNSKVIEAFDNIVIVEGDFKDVLKKTRDMVHIGHRIISYPLAASIRMMYSPTRSILISSRPLGIDEESMNIIDESIQKYEITMGKRNVDEKNRKDYEIIDYDLIISAIEENGFMKCINNL